MSVIARAVVGGLSTGFKPRGGPLQQVRASVAVGWCVSLGLVVVLYDNPVILVTAIATTAVLAVRCRVQRDVAGSLVLSIPLALVIGMINPIASQQGLTVLIAGIDLPLLGTIDVTREAVIYGLILGLRTIAVLSVCALYIATVDPDELLRLLRRVSVRSAITASLAVRFVPVMARDGSRMAEACECRPGPRPHTATIVRAIFARSFDRAGDAAVALETRGFALARPLRTHSRPWRFAESAVLASALLTCGLALGGKIAGHARFVDYPLTYVGAGATDVAFALVILITAAVIPSLSVARLEGKTWSSRH